MSTYGLVISKPETTNECCSPRLLCCWAFPVFSHTTSVMSSWIWAFPLQTQHFLNVNVCMDLSNMDTCGVLGGGGLRGVSCPH